MRDKIANPNSFKQYILAFFAEDEFSILENLNLTLGGDITATKSLETTSRQEAI